MEASQPPSTTTQLTPPFLPFLPSLPPQILSEKVDLRKVNMDVIKRWITDQLIDFLGFEEEVTIGLVINYLESVSKEGGREGGGAGSHTGIYYSRVLLFLLKNMQRRLPTPPRPHSTVTPSPPSLPPSLPHPSCSAHRIRTPKSCSCNARSLSVRTRPPASCLSSGPCYWTRKATPRGSRRVLSRRKKRSLQRGARGRRNSSSSSSSSSSRRRRLWRRQGRSVRRGVQKRRRKGGREGGKGGGEGKRPGFRRR